MNPNQAARLQSDRDDIQARIDANAYVSPFDTWNRTPAEQRSEDVKRLKEIKRLLNDYYLKK